MHYANDTSRDLSKACGTFSNCSIKQRNRTSEGKNSYLLVDDAVHSCDPMFSSFHVLHSWYLPTIWTLGMHWLGNLIFQLVQVHWLPWDYQYCPGNQELGAMDLAFWADVSKEVWMGTLLCEGLFGLLDFDETFVGLVSNLLCCGIYKGTVVLLAMAAVWTWLLIIGRE